MGYNQLLILMTVIFSLVTLFIIIALIIKKQYPFLIVNIVTYVSYIAFLIVQYMMDFQVETYIIVFVLITIIGNNLIGQFLNFYITSQYYDRYLHLFGSFSFALFFYSMLDKIIIPDIRSKIYISIFVASIGISLGCILEIGEFIMDIKNNSNKKNQHGLKDTDTDMISNVIGSITAGIASIYIFL